MNKATKTTMLSITAIIFGAAVLITSNAQVAAYQGDPNQMGPNCTSEQFESVKQAIENNDYNAWVELMQDKGRITEVINQENFSQFAEMRRLRAEGKQAEADVIREELGLGMGKGQHMGQMRHSRFARE